MRKRNDRKGEKNINYQGCKMTIIDYRKYEDIDVQFVDGIVSKNKSYGAFKKGEIKNYNIKSITKKPMKNRIGEENLNSQNKKMKIIEYNNANDIVVEFEDGSIKRTYYDVFKNGNVLHPLDDYNRIGEEGYNNFGSKMIITKYENAHDIEIYFPEYNYSINNIEYSNFKKGDIKCPYEPRTFGIGYLGEGKYKAKIGNKFTLAYKYWCSMMERGYSYDFKNKHKNYINVYVCEEWHNFQNFAEWFYKNYYEVNEERMHLDKDILCKGNKIYSPENCVFVPQRINNLFVKMNNPLDRNGIIGTIDLDNGKCGWQCSYIDKNGKYKRATGTCNTKIEAFQCYKSFKEKVIKDVIDSYEGKIPEPFYSRLREAMYNYRVEIDD